MSLKDVEFSLYFCCVFAQYKTNIATRMETIP